MRATSHTQNEEPFLEHFLSELRFQQAIKYIDKNSVIADIGCGFSGNLLKRIKGKIKTGIGYDISVAKKGLPENILLKKADLNKTIDNRKNYFDVITALAVLEHVENPEGFLKQIKAILKGKGRIIITTPHKRGKTILEFLSLKLGLISRSEIKDHKNYFNERMLKVLLKKVGFKIIKLGSFEFGWNLFCVAQKV